VSLLPELLDTVFAGIGEFEAQREIAGGRKWRASLLGSCLRRQYIELVEKRPYPPVDARTQRIFQVGHLTGELIGKALKSAGILLEEELALDDEEWDIGAHVDFLIGGPVQNGDGDPFSQAIRERVRQMFSDPLPVIGVELKSKSSKSFWWAKKKNEPVAGENQLIQAATYDVLARKKNLHVDRWVVLSVSKDDLSMAEDYVTEEHRRKVMRRLMLLNNATEARDLPCDCLITWNGKGWMYCPYGVSERECC